MKTYVLIFLIGLSFISCQKESDPNPGYPRIYNLNFELLRENGMVYEDDSVQISGEQEIFNGQLRPIGNGEFFWLNLGKLTIDLQNGNSILFGISCAETCDDYLPLPFASGAEGQDMGAHGTWGKEKYWLLRYPNADIDTLRVHDVRTNDPYTRTFTFFINEQPLEGTNFIYDEYAITIRK